MSVLCTENGTTIFLCRCLNHTFCFGGAIIDGTGTFKCQLFQDPIPRMVTSGSAIIQHHIPDCKGLHMIEILVVSRSTLLGHLYPQHCKW